ncbi:uncharacterized protein METZ01_LOCUS222809 [marine metagenome]|uniref:Uncharacterized protein n=1 Tax=marine metagenome TaxID=408172 RepID=A0A382G5A7_9ZZZZ
MSTWGPRRLVRPMLFKTVFLLPDLRLWLPATYH